MGQDPDAIRQDLAQTRAELGETVDAVGDKADVPSRARETVADKADAAKARVREGRPGGPSRRWLEPPPAPATQPVGRPRGCVMPPPAVGRLSRDPPRSC